MPPSKSITAQGVPYIWATLKAVKILKRCDTLESHISKSMKVKPKDMIMGVSTTF